MASGLTDEEYLTTYHPVLSLILHDDPPAVDVSVLGDFVDYLLGYGGPASVPRTLTEFFSEYLSFRIARFLQKDRKRFSEKHLLWDFERTVNRLAKLAYLSRIKGTALTERLLKRAFGVEKGNKREGTTYELESLGLLEAVEENLCGKKEFGGKKNCDNDAIRGSKTTNLNRLSFIEDVEEFGDDEDDNDDYDDDGEEEEEEEEEEEKENKEKVVQTTDKVKPQQGRWWAITGKARRKQDVENHRPDTDKRGNTETQVSKAEGRGEAPELSRASTTRSSWRKAKKNRKFRFKETGMETFLVARYHFLQCTKKCSVDGIHLTPSMRSSARKLPATGDIWRMTFGLLSKSAKTTAILKHLLGEIIEEYKSVRQVEPVDITALCIEVVYETGNASNLAEILDEFTLNATINYSSWSLPSHRLSYSISAVGFLVRASHDIYGVHLSYLRLNAHTIAMLAEPVNSVSDNHLQVLNLSGNYDLGPAAIRRLMRFIVKANHLTHLDLTGCKIGDQGLRILAEFFECCPLQFLRLSSNDITDIGVPALARNFSFVPTLEWLDLSDNRITDRSAAILASALPALPLLRSLDLRRNLLGDFGTDVLTRGLGRLQRITSLVLAENRIGKQGASALVRNLWKTKSLRYVNISLNSIPSKDVNGLRRAASLRGSIQVNADVQKVREESLASLGEHVYVTGEDGAAGGLQSEDEEEEDEEEEEEDLESEKVVVSSKSMNDVYRTIDLLAGRHDKTPADEKSRRLRPRRGPLSRSWHGLNESLRASLRRKRKPEDGS